MHFREFLQCTHSFKIYKRGFWPAESITLSKHDNHYCLWSVFFYYNPKAPPWECIPYLGTVTSSKTFVRNHLVTSHVQFVFNQICGFVINKLLFNVNKNPLTTMCIREIKLMQCILMYNMLMPTTILYIWSFYLIQNWNKTR